MLILNTYAYEKSNKIRRIHEKGDFVNICRLQRPNFNS